MSRIGRKIISVPAGVNVEFGENNKIKVSGPKGTLEKSFASQLTFEIDANVITVKRPSDSKEDKTIHGTTRALLSNMIVGVSEGFKKQLEIRGVGYRATLAGNVLTVNAGYSHPVNMTIPEGLKVELPKNTDIIVTGIDREVVGEFAANIRKIRKPEPYKGKGIRYADEHVRRKEGKTAKK